MKHTHQKQMTDFLKNKVLTEIGSSQELATIVAEAAMSGNIKMLEKAVENLSPDHRAIFEKHFGEAPKAEEFADEETFYNATFVATVNALGATIGELTDQLKADGARVMQFQNEAENAGGAR